MSRRKTGFTLDQHRHYGAHLRAARDLLVEIQTEVSKAYPLTDKALRRALRAVEAVDKLREVLENHAYGENRELDSDSKFSLYRRGKRE